VVATRGASGKVVTACAGDAKAAAAHTTDRAPVLEKE
jgi:hypothetical protein